MPLRPAEQVMVEIDSSFDEKDLGLASSRAFVQDAHAAWPSLRRRSWRMSARDRAAERAKGLRAHGETEAADDAARVEAPAAATGSVKAAAAVAAVVAAAVIADDARVPMAPRSRRRGVRRRARRGSDGRGVAPPPHRHIESRRADPRAPRGRPTFRNAPTPPSRSAASGGAAHARTRPTTWCGAPWRCSPTGR